MKPIEIVIHVHPGVLRYLQALLETGLFGSSVEDVAEQLVREGVRELVVDRFCGKAELVREVAEERAHSPEPEPVDPADQLLAYGKQVREAALADEQEAEPESSDPVEPGSTPGAARVAEPAAIEDPPKPAPRRTRKKLDEVTIRRVEQLLADGELTQPAIAESCLISNSSVARIRKAYVDRLGDEGFEKKTKPKKVLVTATASSTVLAAKKVIDPNAAVIEKDGQLFVFWDEPVTE